MDKWKVYYRHSPHLKDQLIVHKSVFTCINSFNSQNESLNWFSAILQLCLWDICSLLIPWSLPRSCALPTPSLLLFPLNNSYLLQMTLHLEFIPYKPSPPSHPCYQGISLSIAAGLLVRCNWISIKSVHINSHTQQSNSN